MKKNKDIQEIILDGDLSLKSTEKRGKLKQVKEKITDKAKKMVSSKKIETGKFKLVKEKITGKAKGMVSSKNFKKVIKCAAGVIGITSIVLIVKGCADAQNKNVNKEESTTTNVSNVEEAEITTTSDIKEVSGVIIEETVKEEIELEKFASIKYIDKDELVNLFKKAELEFKGTNVTTEELAAFVVEINKTVINSELKQLLISSGVISEQEELNRQNYLNTIDKIRNAMINAKTIEVDPELVGMPEYDALIEELKANAVDINVSNLVSENSNEYEMYKLLDQTYEKIGDSTSIQEAIESYEPVLEYVNSENAKNMPNNMEEEIFKDLYKDAYDEITAAKFSFLVTEVGYVYSAETTECEKTLTK